MSKKIMAHTELISFIEFYMFNHNIKNCIESKKEQINTFSDVYVFF